MRQKRLVKGSATGGRHLTPAPLVSFSVGTAGTNRNWGWGIRMGEAGRMDRLQCMVCYDCNQVTVDNIKARARSMRGAPGPSVFVPEYLPKVDGFLRDPYSFEQYFGLIDRDLDRIVDGMKRRAEVVGAPPQLIVEFLGFGGHSIIGAIIHKKLYDSFPGATFLPVLLIPKEHALEEWMRQGTWDQYEKYLQGQTVLITDNRAGNPGELDNRLSVGLASIECAAYSDPQSGSLAETVASLAPFSSGWFGMSVSQRKLPATAQWEWKQFPPGWQMRMIKGRANELAWEVRSALWECLTPQTQLARHEPPSPAAPQRVVATLPLEADELQEVKEDVMDQLRREGYFEQHPNLNLSFGSARFAGPGGNNNTDLYMYATRFYPLVGPITSVQDIMSRHGQAEDVTNPENIKKTGFGTKYHLEVIQRSVPATTMSNGNGNGNGNGTRVGHPN
jgi:hypothetical protein